MTNTKCPDLNLLYSKCDLGNDCTCYVDVPNHVAASKPKGQTMTDKSMFKVDETYETLGGEYVEIVGIHGAGTDHETVFSISPGGREVNRYNRRDYGRVTGTDHESPDPRNLKIIEVKP